MTFLYYKEELTEETIEIMNKKASYVKLKKIDFIAEQILKEHEITKFPCLLDWSSKKVYAESEEEIRKFCNNKSNYIR